MKSAKLWVRLLAAMVITLAVSAAPALVVADAITDNIGVDGAVAFVPDLFDASPALLWPVFIAQDEGFFRAQSLDVGFGLAVGTLNYVSCAEPLETAAASNDRSFAVVALLARAAPLRLVARGTIATARDLSGKTVVLRAKNDPLTALFERWLRENGVAAASVTEHFDIAAPNRYVELANGSVDAALLPGPYDLDARAAGAHVVLDAGRYAPRLAAICLTASRLDLVQRPAAIRAYLRALASAVDWLAKPEHRGAAIALLERKTALPHDVAVAMYDDVATQSPFSPGLALDGGAFANLFGLLIASGAVTSTEPAAPLLERILDRTYLPS
jgi:ABC-type nitrate/sulfonate/bicarbonate transport system substrate-binding protein